MFKKSSFYIINICLPILISCSSGETTYTVEIIDGVKFIHNDSPLWGDEQKISLKFVREIGGLDETDQGYILFRPKDVALDNARNIFVLDAGNHRVQKYDPQGKYLATFGRQGQGPGELDSPEYMQSDDEGNIYVYDRGSEKFIVYDNSGKNINNIALVSESDFQILHSGNFAVFPRTFYSGPAGDQSESQALVKVYNSVMELRNDFGIKNNMETAIYNRPVIILIILSIKTTTSISHSTIKTGSKNITWMETGYSGLTGNWTMRKAKVLNRSLSTTHDTA